MGLLFFTLFRLTNDGRMIRWGFFGRLERKRDYLCLLRDLQGLRKDYPFRFPQLRRSFNPSLIESFFPSLSTVNPAHRGDLYSKSIFGLSYTNVVAVLLSLIPLLLGFNLVLLSLPFGFFSLVLKFVSLL